MLAQRTLEAWAATAPAAVLDGLATALASELDPAARARLVETVGLVPAADGIGLLTQVGLDDARGHGRARRGPVRPRRPPRRPADAATRPTPRRPEPP